MMKKLLIALLLVLGFNLVKAQNTSPAIPKAMREFRAAWIATVANINWPSKPGLSVSEQQQEAINLLNLFQPQNINSAILQVRP
jgi:uncharacterized lipoprotein YddW (UPF0748 family)